MPTSETEAAVENIIGLAREKRRGQKAESIEHANDWPEPKPLPGGLAPVDSFNSDFLPDALAPWVEDIANRLQCPPDYVAVAALTSFGSLVGRRIGIKPQSKTDWIEIPNLWGCIIGRPGMLKSPAMMEALKPLHHLEVEAEKAYGEAFTAHQAALAEFKLEKSVKESILKEELKKKAAQKVVSLGSFSSLKEAIKEAQKDPLGLGPGPEEPKPVRYRTNDSSYEAIGELLVSNPTGLLVERDELVSLLKHLDREDQSVARGFYLSGWSGTQSYSFDRISRGHIHVDAVCIAVLGNTQPARIAEYIHRANHGGAGGDGLIQRFGLLVWPDAPADWQNIDEYPNREAREQAWKVYEDASKIDEATAFKLGAEKGQYDKVPALRFDEAAQQDFLDWRTDLETRVRSGELSPALEGHLAKYRTLVPSLALLNHLAERVEGAVSQRALLKALAIAHYLESHARRVYGSADEAELAAAKAILKHIRTGDLKDAFSARDIHQHGWSHLTEREQVGAGLGLLDDLDYIAASVPSAGARGGRPKVTYRINPRISGGGHDQ
jgi:phage tail protein X